MALRILKTSALLLLLLLPGFILSSCKKDSPVEVKKEEIETPDTSIPGRRDYIWTVDTLKMPSFIYLETVWGADPLEVWAVGPGDMPGKRLQVFDGKYWKEYSKELIQCPAMTMYGFNRNDIWMAGMNGDIWHYDGVRWSQNFRYEGGDRRDAVIFSICGSSSANLYACGAVSKFVNEKLINTGFLLHFDGYSWKTVCDGMQYTNLLRVKLEAEKVYVYAYMYENIEDSNDYEKFYELSGNCLKEIYSKASNEISGVGIACINNKIYFCLGNDVTVYKQNKFVTQFTVNEPTFRHYLFGRNLKDIFIPMHDGLAHYNGENIQYLFRHPTSWSMNISGEVVFDKEVFCAIYDFGSNKNLVLHGKIKD